MPEYSEYMATTDVESALKVAFDMPPFYDFFPTIAEKYRRFEFSDRLTDEQRLGEYASVYQQLRKFVARSEAQVMSRRENLALVLDWACDQKGRSDVYPKTRVDMAYNSLKVDWLTRLINQAASLIEERSR